MLRLFRKGQNTAVKQRDLSVHILAGEIGFITKSAVFIRKRSLPEHIANIAERPGTGQRCFRIAGITDVLSVIHRSTEPDL